jgi:hypothetical protein
MGEPHKDKERTKDGEEADRKAEDCNPHLMSHAGNAPRLFRARRFVI